MTSNTNLATKVVYRTVREVWWLQFKNKPVVLFYIFLRELILDIWYYSERVYTYLEYVWFEAIIPTLPIPQAIQIQAPHLPAIKAPRISVPKIKSPDLPEVKLTLPRLQLAKLDFHLPKISFFQQKAKQTKPQELVKNSPTPTNTSGNLIVPQVVSNQLSLPQQVNNQLTFALSPMLIRKIRGMQFQLWLLIAIVLAQSVFMVFFSGQSIDLARATNNQTSESLSSLPSTSDPGRRIITDFSTNKGVVDIGYSLRVQKTSIDLKNINNCSTPIVPPEQNGCHFTILPNALGIPSRGTIFKNIQFETSLPGESKLQLDIKDYEKGELVKEIGTVNSENVNRKLPLPEFLGNGTGIFVRFWVPNQNVKITKIVLEYNNVKDLKPVSGSVGTEIVSISPQGMVYRDMDENELFDPKIDQLWICRPYFPGVKLVSFGATGGFVMQRDDNCFVDVKPDNWYIDEGKNVLPQGKWLLVVGSDKTTTALPFEVLSTDESTVLDFDNTADK